MISRRISRGCRPVQFLRLIMAVTILTMVRIMVTAMGTLIITGLGSPSTGGSADAAGAKTGEAAKPASYVSHNV